MKATVRVSVFLLVAVGCEGRSQLNSSNGPKEAPPAISSQRAALARRKSAEQIVNSLKTQLGLTDEDVFAGNYRDAPSELYPARSPDGVPLTSENAQYNYVALGGPSWLKGKKGSSEPSTIFAQQLVPMSQAWCRLALQKPGNPLLVHASLSDSSSTSEGRDRIGRNIARLHLRMLGEQASDADVADLFELFQAYEPNGAEIAWTAVCAALARHPLWITF